MSARLRLLAGIVSVGLASTLVVAAAPGASAGTGTSPATPAVPVQDWAATFCTTFASYETDALAAAGELQTALAGAADSTSGTATKTSLAGLMTRASGSAGAAATAATANGVPDVAHGRALTRVLRSTLRTASKVYARVAEESSALPENPAKLSRAAKRLGTDLAGQLDAQGTHAKRLRRLDASNQLARAISADPTCAAAAKAGG